MFVLEDYVSPVFDVGRKCFCIRRSVKDGALYSAVVYIRGDGRYNVQQAEKQSRRRVQFAQATVVWREIVS